MNTNASQQVNTFFAKYPLRTYEKRQVLVRAEDAFPGIFYIVEGHISQYDITTSGNVVVVNVFKSGAFFPVSAAINHAPNHYFFEASTRAVVHVAPLKDVEQFLQTHPEVVLDLLSRIYRGLDGVLRRMVHLMGGDARSRLVFELLNAAYRFGESQLDGSVLIALKEGDLAKRSGLARETINRTMHHLKAAGLIEVNQAGIIIKNPGLLEGLLSGDA